jgi:hypothetical protein
MLKHRAVTQSRVADYETQRKLPRTDDAETQSCYTVQSRRCWNTEEAARTDDDETQRKPLHSQRSSTTLSTNHRSYIRMLTQSRAQFTWLKQPANCDAETTSTTTRRRCYSSRNNNTSFNTCNNILLHETRTSYSGLESRSD